MERFNPRRLKLAAVLVAGAAVLSACSISRLPSNPEIPTSSAAIDLVRNGTWAIAGVEKADNSLRVTPTDLAIVEQDGSPREDNPAINLFGTHIDRKGDFSVALKVSDRTGTAHITLGTPPLIEDEFRAELGTLSLTMNDSTLEVSLSDQTAGKAYAVDNLPLTDAPEHILALAVTDDILTVSANGTTEKITMQVGDTLGKSIWFGLDAREGAFTIDAFTVQGEHNDTVATRSANTTIPKLKHGLASLVETRRPDMKLGAAIAPGPLVSEPKYRELLGNFNAISIENAAKWQFIHPAPDVYNFADMDGMVQAALKAKQKVHGHALIFGEANPQWVQDLAGNPEALKQAAVDHITTIMKRYRGKVASWDVINEPLADYDTDPGSYGLRKNIWYETLGPDYHETMLRAAHEADPKAELWINDFGMEADGERFQQMLDLVDRLRAHGVPLTGIGFQAHIDEGDTNTTDTHIDVTMLRSRIQELEKRGLRARFSELDISNASEHAVFSDTIRACLGEKACTSVTVWGVTDKYSSGGDIDQFGIFHPSDVGLLWDKNFKATRGIEDIRRALR